MSKRPWPEEFENSEPLPRSPPPRSLTYRIAYWVGRLVGELVVLAGSITVLAWVVILLLLVAG